MPWITLDELKDHLEIPASDTASDAEIASVLMQATDWVEARVGPISQQTIVDVLPAGPVLILSTAPVVSVTSVVGANGYAASYDVSTLYLDQSAGLLRCGLGARFTTPVVVTYVAGTNDPPEAFRGAALEIARALWAPQRGGAQAAAALATGGFDDGSPSEGNLGLAQYRAEQLLAPYALGPSIA